MVGLAGGRYPTIEQASQAYQDAVQAYEFGKLHFKEFIAKIEKGNSTPGRTMEGKVTMADVKKIAKEKMVDLNAIDLEGAANTVKGSARSMGMEVVE